MDISAPTVWWILAGMLVAIEMVTGTIYLLALALGAAAGALAAHAGLGLPWQVVCAALVGGGTTAVWHARRARQPRSAPAASNRDVILDIGQTVHVSGWATDGTARVHYRGCDWSVRYAGSGQPQPGEHSIVAVQGNQLDVCAIAASH